MIEERFIIATAGHVDHGKTALVKALTGVDPDRLPEEKARGITIDLGFAELNLTGSNGEPLHVGIIDVPGHEDFVRNMIAGVGSIDLALFVVAADDGWMPQTEEHLQILTYLGVTRAVVVLTKSDLADPVVAENDVREQLCDTVFIHAPIVHTSFASPELAGWTGQVVPASIVELKNAIARELSRLPGSHDVGKSRLFVDRAFTLRGIGTVVTGTLTGGTFSRGQSVTIRPKNLTARIRTIQTHGREIETGLPGSRTALNLADIGVGFGQNAVARGDVIAAADLGDPAELFHVLVQRSSRASRDSPMARPIKNRSSVYIHHGTTRSVAKITFLDRNMLSCGDSGIGELRLASPLFAFVGDRFVLRDPSERYTIGGGIILNTRVGEIDRRVNLLGSLSARATAPDDCAIYVRSELSELGFADRSTLLRQSNFSVAEISKAVTRLVDEKTIIVAGSIAADGEQWRALLTQAAQLIDNFHQQHPEQRGITVSELRSSLSLQSNAVFAALLEELRHFVRIEDRITRKTHRAALPPDLRNPAEQILATLSAKPFDPPSRADLAKNREQQQALRFLIDQGELTEIGPDIVLTRDAAGTMERMVVEFISQSGPASASQLRQVVDSSRRIMIPFLEQLDRLGVTQRVGDSRRLREKKTAAVTPK